MTRLLVSVRDVDEARDAWRAGAHLIDLKEPARGPLAACPISVWSDVRGALADAVPLSVALGELLDADAIELADRTAGFQFAKVGLSGCRERPDWRTRWRDWRDRLPLEVAPVAVAYADHTAAGAPSPHDVLSLGRELGCHALLIDTFVKDGRSLYAHLALPEVARLVHDARRCGMLAVLGGSLRLADVPISVDLAPDFVAVRGAVCSGARDGRLDPARVTEWTQSLQESPVGLRESGNRGIGDQEQNSKT